MSKFEVIRGVEGCCLALDDTRIAGPKPWGGGTVIHEWETDKEYRAERTCEPTLNDSKTAVICSWCGAGMPLQGFEEIRTWDGEMQIATFSTYRYCPNCGARVER